MGREYNCEWTEIWDEETISNIEYIENVEDCDCQTTVSDVGLNRLEKITDFKDLSNRISILKSSDDINQVICFFLFIIAFSMVPIFEYVYEMYETSRNDPIFGNIIERIYNRWENRMQNMNLILEAFNCWDYWNP
jgi:hypothetical protein